MLNTGLVKALGQQSDTVTASNLTGNWIPGTGVEASYWDNQVGSGNNLRRFNSITHNSASGGTPAHWNFDGVDDYLGEAAVGYGGSPFVVSASSAYTLACWIKYPTSGNVYMFGLGNYTSGGTLFFVRGSDKGPELYVNNSTTNFSSIKTVANNTWVYLAYTHDGSNDYKVYLNGSFIGSATKTGATGSLSLNVGKGFDGGSQLYSTANSKLGHVHVYSSALGSSQLRQNFLATHSINNSRTYGTDYTA